MDERKNVFSTAVLLDFDAENYLKNCKDLFSISHTIFK